MTRDELHDRFNAFYNARTPPVLFDLDEINDVEQKIGVKLPKSYVSFALKYGAVFTPEILTLICTHSAENQALQEFFDADEILANHEGLIESDANPPARIVPFAMDGMGNIFIFKELPVESSRPDDAPVWFFDHEYVTFEEIAPSFDAWLEGYLKIGIS